ncbi:MAG: protein kinase [Acidobacteriota bacterium]
MSLASGRRIGPYEIVALVGAGGMGEVYRATDTRLDRIVAIKVLPSGLSANENLRGRFEREARAIAALSHPNICTLYDVGNEDGIEYLVMEYLEGETLAERLERGPLPPTLILRYGAQIADALQRAHRAGITHRDLKPGNIMLTSSGAKLLDFGLAKIIEHDPAVFSASTPTQVNPLTTEGSIVGTTMYMSPEQLEGKRLDHRTDIFSLGVVLYEMVTGQRPFRADSKVGLIAAILSSDPAPARSLQPAVPPALERIILTALEKDPEERWQTAQDVGRQLRWMSESSQPAEPATVPPKRRLPAPILIVAAVLAASLLTWLGVRQLSSPRTVAGRVSLQFATIGLEASRSTEFNDFALSPDGRMVALVAPSGGINALFLRRIDSYDIRKLEHTEGASCPFWSSNGEWVGYAAHSKLWKLRIGGGAPPAVICDLKTGGARSSWLGRTILFAEYRGDRKEIYRVEEGAGVPVKVTSLGVGEWRHSWPSLLPDGKHFLYESFAAGSLERTLVLASFDSPARTVLARNISFARLLGQDRLVWVRDGTLLTQRFDLDRGAPLGEETIIAMNVAYFYLTGRADFDASPSGALIYRTDTSTGRLVSVDRKGAVIRIVDDKELFWDHALSPDGTKAAVTVVTRATGVMDIWIYDLARGMRDRFTSDPAIEVSPAWSPDGKTIVYSQGEGGVFPHLVRRALSSPVAEPLTPKGSFQFTPSFTPDGETVFFESQLGGGQDINRVGLKSGKTEPFLKTDFNEESPAVSPDGKWLAYSSDATGHQEAYIQSLTDGAPLRIRISSKGGLHPAWRRDGKELFYVSAEMVVTSATPDPAVGWERATVNELFRIPGEIRGFAVAPDGQSFLISYWNAGPADDLFHVIINWQ